MKKTMSLLGLLALISCAPQSSIEQNAPGKLLRSNLSRLSALSLDSAEVKSAAHAQTEFALDLYKTLAPTNGNLFFSLFSISSAMAMLYAGAHGVTEQQIASGMHFGLEQKPFHQAINALNQNLQTSNSNAFRLNIDNNIWVQETYPLEQSYLDLLMQHYGSGVHSVDFVVHPEVTRSAINDWISNHTEKRIQDLLPTGSINPSTALVLTNSIYFKARWENEFNPAKQKNFHLLNNQTKSAEMMGIQAHFNYASGKNYEAIEIPYDNNSATMVLQVPALGHFSEFETNLNLNASNTLQYREVILTMPKFSFKNSFDVAATLKAFGIQDAFESGKADFSGIDGTKNIYVSQVLHQAFIKVDEQGTEAAAATTVVTDATASPAQPEEPIALTIDGPLSLSFVIIKQA